MSALALRRLASIAVVGVLASCGDPSVGSEPGLTAPAVTDSPSVTTSPSTIPATNPPPSTAGAPQLIRIVDTHPDIAWYPACGNETISVDGVDWYQRLDQFGVDENGESVIPFDPTPYEAPPRGAQSLLRIVPPGPGDDIGTIYVYEDGVGRFVSDSGRLERWLDTVGPPASWVC